MQGLSPRNLGYMKAFAEAWPDDSILQQAVAKLPWGHNVRLLDLVKDRPSASGMPSRRSRTAGAETSSLCKSRAGFTAGRERR